MPDIFISNKKQDNPSESPENSNVDNSSKKPLVPASLPTTESQKISYEGHSHNKLAAFCLYPDDIDFETRETQEKIILMLRAHIVTNVGWVLLTGILIFTPGFLKALGVFSLLPTGFDLVITLAWYLFTAAYALEKFLSWYFNVYFITNIRIIDVDFYNLIYKQVSDANISKIQDVSYNMGGVARTFFNYGNVFVQTAAEVSEFNFLAVPNPDKVAKIIEDLITKEGGDE